MDGPIGVNGLHEDISGADLPPVIYAAQLALDLERQKPKPQFHQLYRDYAPRLRDIANGSFFGKEEARKLLKSLYLQQTLPENELHSPDWVDGYTGEPVVETMEDKELVVEELAPVESMLSEWQRYLAMRAPYQDESMANQFIEANWEYPGAEEEIPFEEDRGYEPDHFEVNREGRPDGHLQEVWERTAVERRHLSELIEQGRKQGLMADQIRALVQKDSDFLQRLQDLINEGINPANVAMVFMRWQHGLGFDPEHAELIELPTQTINLHGQPPMTGKCVPAQEGTPKGMLDRLFNKWIDENSGTGSQSFATPKLTLRDFINEYWEELSESLEAMGPAFARGPVSDAEISEMTEGWLEDYLEQIPIEAPIRRSRWFCEGYMKAVLAGNPRPQDEGMTNWRRKTSPEGAKAYDEAIKHGATIRQAMGVFWRHTKRPGPQVPKRVVAIKPTGLKLASGRFIAWSVAIKIAREEGFEDQERLKQVLSNRGWGQPLVAAL